MTEPKKREKDEDEVTIAKSIFDEVVAESEKDVGDKDEEKPSHTATHNRHA